MWTSPLLTYLVLGRSDMPLLSFAAYFPNPPTVPACPLVVRSREPVELHLHEWAFALAQRAKGLSGRNCGAHLVIVPGSFALLGLFHLEQKNVVELAAIGTDRARAEQLILGRDSFHFRDYSCAVCI